MNRPEILAPAGTFEALEAAVKAGADAVYAGGSMFSARAYAGNFDKDEMIRAIDYCHFFDVKLYIAFNTLLNNNETEKAAEYIRPFYEEGLDGAIVQDMAVAGILSDEFPDLPLHASTQMSISSHYGAKMLKKIGFTRVVPARELSLDEIRAIKSETGMEIETFVHGAMCYCYSGRCLLSSFLGGRSGNRGRCAQPCRQKYYTDDGKDLGYCLSLKDMCTIEMVPELAEAGIDSFKIEGRMKKPEYVALTVELYKKALERYLDGCVSEEQTGKAVDALKDIYNRGGFSSGYYHMSRDRSMLADKRPNHTGLEVGSVTKTAPPKVYIKTVRDINTGDVLEIRREDEQEGVELTSPCSAEKGKELVLNGREFARIRKNARVYRTRNNTLIDDLHERIIDPEKYIVADAYAFIHKNEPVTITISDKDVSISVTGNNAEPAQKAPLSEDTVAEKIKKTGGTGVRLNVSCDIEDNVFVQMGELNSLRREAIRRFIEAKVQKGRRR